MLKISRHCVALMLALSLGLHWTVLQSVAWMGMLVSYSAEGTFGEAFVRTFDGQNPCKLCITVAEGKKSEKEQDQLKSFGKGDWVFTESTVLLFRPASRIAPVPDVPRLRCFGTAPPSPPPRTA